MPDMTEAFDAPFVYSVSETEKISFQKFDLDELAEMGANLKAERIRLTDELVKRENLEGIEAYRAKQEASWTQVLDNDIFAYVETPKGTSDVLHKSLLMGGMKDEAERKATMKKIPPLVKKHIALVITGLAIPTKRKEIVSESGGKEPAFGDAVEKEVSSPLPDRGLMPPSS